MKKGCSVLQILLSMESNEVTRLGINQLIELTQNFAFTYLKYRYKNLNKLTLAEDATLDELAIDSIAPLFERDEKRSFVKLKNAFDKWQPPIETEEQALFFLNRMAAKSVEKYVSELLRYSDPFFSKILDSVNYLVIKQNYKKKLILGTTYIVENEELKRIGCLPDSQFIFELPADLFFDLNKMIPGIFTHLKNNTDKELAIPLNALVTRLKKLKASHFIISDKVELTDELSVGSMVSNALKLTIEKLKESYSAKGKCTESEVSSICKALENVAYDIKDGGINPGLHKYFLEQFPEKSFEDYKTRYQNIFEYLYKVLKNEITRQLTGDR